VDLSLDRPEALLRTGDLFGEMTCMSFYPRSATVRARGPVVALEMLRNILDVLKRGSKELKEQLDRAYKERALAAHLKAMPLFEGLTDEFIAGLRERVKLVPATPEGHSAGTPPTACLDPIGF
jgi:CRP-like cAMP-binding protein